MAIVPNLSGDRADLAPVTDVHIENNQLGAVKSYAVTLSDTVDLPQGIPLGISCDVGGTVKFTYSDGTLDTVTLAGGVIHPISGVKRVWNAGTTATGVHAHY